LNTQDYLKTISKSKKPFIIYKSKKGFDLYTNFSKKIILTNKNINNFINKINKKKLKN
jgi:para-aminobenzoate synthetase component 1